MARIPRIDNNGRSRIAPVSAPRAAPGKFGSLGGTVSDLGESLLHIEDAVKKVATLHQVTRATVDSNKRIMEVQDAALIDPDLDTNLPKYQQQIKQIAQESITQVADPLARMELQGNLSTRMTALDFQLATEARKTLGRKTLEVLEESRQQHLEQIYRAPNEALTQQEIVSYASEIDSAVAVGAMSPIEGRKLAREFSDDARDFAIDRHIEMDPEGALAVLQSGRHGITNPKTVERLTTKAKDKFAADVAQGKAILNDLQDTNELDAFKALTEDKLTLSVLESKEARQDIRPKFRDALQANLLSTERAAAVTQPEVFLDLLTQATRTSKWAMAGAVQKTLKTKGIKKPSTDVQTLMINIIAANTQGELSSSDMQQLVGIIDADFQKAATAARHPLYAHILDAVTAVMPGGFGAAARALRVALPLMRRIEKGEVKEQDVDQELTRALKHEVRVQHPGLAAREDVPNAISHPFGSMQPVFDGESTDPAEVTMPETKKVPMRHPDGSLLMVPEAVVAQAEAQGAVKISAEPAVPNAKQKAK